MALPSDPNASMSPTTDLEWIDVHSIDVSAGAEDVWPVMWRVVVRSFDGRLTETVAAALGCDPRRGENVAAPRARTTTLPGFRVAAVTAPTEVVLEGTHRFARYRLTFRIDSVGDDRARVHAATHADFPGLRGFVYRTLVLGSGGHVVVVNRLLKNIKRSAESTAPGRLSAS